MSYVHDLLLHDLYAIRLVGSLDDLLRTRANGPALT